MRTDNRGMVLMMVIWVMALLIIIVTAFAFSVKTGVLSAAHYKDEVREAFLAEGGIEYGTLKLLNKKLNPLTADSIKIDGTPYPRESEGGKYTVSFLDEGAKVDINRTSSVILKALMDNLGIAPETRDIIADSVEDWRDMDNLHRLNGAEDDYYSALPVPYKARNADFESIEELMMVRGVTEEALYGGNGKKGLYDFITIYSADGAINVNSAPREVLISIPGMTDETVKSIIAFREGGTNMTLQDLQSIASGAYGLMAPYVTSSEGNVYSIESTAESTGRGEKEGGYRVKATIRIEGPGKYRTLYWKDRAPVS